MHLKRCAGCKLEKPAAEYHKKAKAKDGLQHQCKSCKREYAKNHPISSEKRREYNQRAYRKNPEPAKAAARRRRQRYPESCREDCRKWYQENREYARQKNAEWRAHNRDHQREYLREWQAKNPEAGREWRKNNPEKSRSYVQKRRARIAAASLFDFSAEELIQRWDYYGNRCWICREQATETDHVKPLSKGGAHMLANLRPVCRACNASKGSSWPFFAEGLAAA